MKKQLFALLGLFSLCLQLMAEPSLHVCSVATHKTKQVDQLIESAKQNGVAIEILGEGGFFRGKAEKLLYVQRYLESLPDDDVVLFVDGYDSLLLADEKTILERFKSVKAPFVIAAEKTCWPDVSVAAQFPQSPTSFKYINSGTYIGYVKEVKEHLAHLAPIQAENDDQLLFTKHFLAKPSAYMLDTSCKLFLPTFGVTKKELALDVQKRNVTVLETGSLPCVIHGNGRSPWYQHIYDQFFAKKPSDKAKVFLTLIFKENELVSSVKECVQAVENLDYIKQHITVYVNAAAADLEVKKVLTSWAEKNQNKYAKVIVDEEAQGASKTPFKLLGELKNKSVQKAKESKCDFYFVVGSDDLLTPCTLKELVAKDKPIVAPMLKAMPEGNDYFSNYYMAVTESGYYKDHHDYFKVLSGQITGTFKVPLVHGCYLVKSQYLDKISSLDDTNDYEFIVFSRNARKMGIDQYVCNEKDFGEMVHFNENLTYAEKEAKLKDSFALSSSGNPEELTEADLEYIKSFPMAQYEVFHAKGQGLFYLDGVDDVIKNELKAGRLWEHGVDQVIARYAKPNSIALDVGAHIGTHTIAMSQAVGARGKVYAFEPQKKIFRELFLNLKINGCSNVAPMHMALGAENRYIYLDDPVDDNEGSRFIAYGAGTEKVLLKTLDSLHLDNISFIKVDVENYEEAFLDGAKETIARCKPVMLIEILGNCILTPRYGADYKKTKTRETIAKLERMGYTVSNFSFDDYLAIPKQPS